MKARMEKYSIDTPVKKRTSRNEKLYDEVLDMSIDYVNIDVNNAVDLTVNNNSRTTREDYQKRRELNKIIPENKARERVVIEEVEPKEDRIYDIDEILKLARENKLFEDQKKKRLINTEYNILTKLDIQSLESDEIKKEDLRSLIDDIYEKEKPKKVKNYPRKEEEQLLNELFDDYNTNKEIDDEIKLKEELSKNILENSITEEKELNDTKENTITKKEKKKEDKEEKIATKIDTNISDDYIEVEKEGKGLLIAIIIVTILILLTCGFFVYEYFFGI